MVGTERLGCSLNFTLEQDGELLLAAGLLTIIFALAYSWPLYFAFTVGASGLILHEMGHKIVGRYFCISNTEFVIKPIGIIIGFASALLFHIVLASPGGVTIGDNATKHDIVMEALGGPVTNLLIFGVTFPLAYLAPIIVHVGGMTINVFLTMAIINLYYGTFNLLPVPPLDGWRVVSRNEKIWALVFVPAIITVGGVYYLDGNILQSLFALSGPGIISFSQVKEDVARKISSWVINTPSTPISKIEP